MARLTPFPGWIPDGFQTDSRPDASRVQGGFQAPHPIPSHPYVRILVEGYR